MERPISMRHTIKNFEHVVREIYKGETLEPSYEEHILMVFGERVTSTGSALVLSTGVASSMGSQMSDLVRDAQGISAPFHHYM